MNARRNEMGLVGYWAMRSAECEEPSRPSRCPPGRSDRPVYVAPEAAKEA